MALVKPRRPLSGLWAIALAVSVAVGAEAVEPARPTEYEVKAAFLYNFAKFVKWSPQESPRPTFVIAVMGDDPFGPILEKTFAGKTLEDRAIEIRRIQASDDASRAQLLFVGSSEKGRLAQVLKPLQGASVLTVGDMEGFVDHGGMIGFRVRDDVVRFDVNLVQVEHANLKMSSQIIRLAQRVIGGGS